MGDMEGTKGDMEGMWGRHGGDVGDPGVGTAVAQRGEDEERHHGQPWRGEEGDMEGTKGDTEGTKGDMEGTQRGTWRGHGVGTASGTRGG